MRSPREIYTRQSTLFRNVADYVNEHDVEAAIVSYDQATAFDRVSHESYLFNVLRAFGFSENFVSWVCLLYNDISSRLGSSSINYCKWFY